MTEVVSNFDSSPEQRNEPVINKNIKCLLWGGGASALGDQMTLVAFPWLVLSITQEAWVLGLILGLVGIPKAVFILLGGAIVDRLSPKTVMLISKVVNAVVLFLISFLLYVNELSVPILCVLAFIFGMSEALSMPARSAILPALVKRENLEKVNGMFMFLGQVMLIFGPLIAGVFLGLNNEGNTNSLFLLFAFDSATYIFSAITLSMVVFSAFPKPNHPVNLLKNIIDGVKLFWGLDQLKSMALYVALAGCFAGGMLQIGLPLLVKDVWLVEGDVFGYLLAVAGLGAAIGAIFAAKFPQVKQLSLGVTYLSSHFIVGLLLILLAHTAALFMAFPLMFFISFLSGYVQVGLISWIQRQVPLEMMGRIMSIIMFITIGLVPVSALFFGCLIDYLSVEKVFIVSGISLSFLAVLGFKSKELSSIERSQAM